MSCGSVIRLAVFGAGAILVLLAATGSAQTLSGEPITLMGGRLTIGGDATLSIAPRDPGAYFNRTDYNHDTTRLLRLDLTAAFRPHPRVMFVSDIRTENAEWLRPYALYLKVTPWPDRAFDVRVGRIPPAFGAFARRNYAADNPLIGAPLAYQYLTSIRPDAIPISADDLLRMRGRGWLTGYALGDAKFRAGLPLVNALRWDTGLEVRVGSQPLELVAALTTGTLSNPRLSDDNDGKQIAARLAFKPSPAVTVAASAARGPFLSRQAVSAIPRDSVALTQVIVAAPPDDPYGTGPSGSYGSTTTAELAVVPAAAGAYVQRAFGLDAEFSSGYWLIRTEAIFSQWSLPAILAPYLNAPLGAVAFDVEGRYKVWPGVFLAGRVDHLHFSKVLGSSGLTTWDAPVSRVESGIGIYLRRNLIWKVVYQGNWRDGGRVRRLHVGASQLLFWF
ncbi:MAG: hypothetical protein HYZ58_10075 [Acidobacteria bacterium]|nr:hypothetical protein [Acidobacteriota bacterium]